MTELCFRLLGVFLRDVVSERLLLLVTIHLVPGEVVIVSQVRIVVW